MSFPNKHVIAIAKLETALHFLATSRSWFGWLFVGIVYAIFFLLMGLLYDFETFRTIGHYALGAVIGISIGLSCITVANRRLLKEMEE